MTEEITGNEDVLDSRDIDERIAELGDEIRDLKRMIKGSPPDDYVYEREELADYKRERKELRRFRAEVSHSEWPYGMTFIADFYFEEYAEEMAYDIGAISREALWPLNRIDWSEAADDLKVDYICVELFGNDYWHRS